MEDGVLLVDKPKGITSHDVVGFCRRFFSRKDIGHAGTLDPMATGLLVILIGKATKLSDYILNGDKSYQADVLLGTTTDTDDITGEVLTEKGWAGQSEEVEKAIAELTGEFELPVPIYSAIKVKGKKLYEKARKGENFEPPMKTMAFYDVSIQKIQAQDVVVSFRCMKGSYVRAWAKALGNNLGCGGTLQGLRRLQSGTFSVEQAITLEQLENTPKVDIFQSQSFVPLQRTLPDWPLVKVEGLDEKLLYNGQISRKLERFLELEYASQAQLPGVKVISRRSGHLVSLLSFTPPLSFKIRRVFPNQ